MVLKFPFPKWLPKVPVQVYLTRTGRLGGPEELLLYDGLAFYDEKSKQIMTPERQLVELSGLLIIEGDIALQSPTWPSNAAVDGSKSMDSTTTFDMEVPAYEFWEYWFGEAFAENKLEGYVKVIGQQKNIHRTLRPRNPDGTVFSTELMLS